jgi:hypothetical protein
MAVNANAKIGFWTGIGFLGALLVWNLLANRIPAIKQYAG